MRLIDKLEELEDLQAVYHTMDITCLLYTSTLVSLVELYRR